MSENVILMLLGGVGVSVFVYVGWWILQIIAYWMVFGKAKEAGWKSIIPFVSGHTAYKICWKPWIFWLSVVLSGATVWIQNIQAANGMTNETGGILILVLYVCSIISMVISIMFCNKMAKAFGKGIGFTLGLLFLHPIFIMILGFGSAEYKGANQ